MKPLKTASLTLLFTANAALSHSAWAIELRGSAGAELRYFTEYQKTQASAFGELELYWQSENSNNSITAKAFARGDDTDDERSHADIRELVWLYYADTWEVRAGISKVFWGVTESAHRVDIVNQTDAVESPDGEEKLGQPMLQFTRIHDWGTLNAFILPYFRERTLDGPDSYLGMPAPVALDDAQYQSSAEQAHIDWALRYKHSIDIWDVGLSYFAGTDREPLLIPALGAEGEPVLVPYYTQIHQAGIDVQATVGSWLWKLEAIHQSTRDNGLDATLRAVTEDFSALTTGFEYTLIGVAGSQADLGLLGEYHHNSAANNALDPLQNDLFIGARLTLNDIQNTSLLVGLIQDLDYSSSQLGFIEASRRFGDNWVLTLDGRLYASDANQDPIQAVRKGDHMTLNAAYYF
ncbi:MAG TPA: hypothetical protein VIC26_03920 [Marinagarivorans sp.]